VICVVPLNLNQNYETGTMHHAGESCMKTSKTQSFESMLA
jgi:hypothetical protein